MIFPLVAEGMKAVLNSGSVISMVSLICYYISTGIMSAKYELQWNNSTQLCTNGYICFGVEEVLMVSLYSEWRIEMLLILTPQKSSPLASA